MYYSTIPLCVVGGLELSFFLLVLGRMKIKIFGKKTK